MIERHAIYRCEHCGQRIPAERVETQRGDVLLAMVPLCTRHEMPVVMVRKEELSSPHGGFARVADRAA